MLGASEPDRWKARTWSLVLRDAWKDAALGGYGLVALAITAWGLLHQGDLERLVIDAGASGAWRIQADARANLLTYAACALPFAALFAGFVLFRERACKPRPPTFWAPLCISLIGTPLLGVTMFEYRFLVLTGIVVLSVALGISHAAVGVAHWRPAWVRDLSPRAAFCVVLCAFLLFTVWMGCLAQWRFITFHAEPYDMSWETNAVHNIVHTGIPRISVGAGSFFRGQLLPANYASNHTPFIYYLYAPFYALYQDGRTLLWLQAATLGSGAFGAYLFARRWLRSRALGAAFAVAYLCHPSVQTSCLHDVHANYLAIPMLLLALGFMEERRYRLALVFAFLTCICREETSVYGLAGGLFWALGPSRDRTRIRFGWVTIAMSLSVLLLLTKVVMPAAGGKPHYGRFVFYYDTLGIASILKSYVLNPLGAVQLLLDPMRLQYLWLSLLPLGFLTFFGWQAAWFLIIPLGLQIPSFALTFYVAGMNYSCPIVIPVVVMAVFGARRWLIPFGKRRAESISARRLGVGAFVLTCGFMTSYLHGDIFSKTYKTTFGSAPFRQNNQFNYLGQIGIQRTLPPFGKRERALWQLIAHVPKNVPISTSWRVNPQLSNRAVSLLYPEDGSAHPKVNLAKYIVIDRLTPMTFQTEEWERKLRADRRFRVYYENIGGVIFERLP